MVASLKEVLLKPILQIDPFYFVLWFNMLTRGIKRQSKIWDGLSLEKWQKGNCENWKLENKIWCNTLTTDTLSALKKECLGIEDLENGPLETIPAPLAWSCWMQACDVYLSVKTAGIQFFTWWGQGNKDNLCYCLQSGC